MTRFVIAFVALAGCLRAELTAEQREFDFRVLAAMYAKHYAPYEWKRDALGFDLLDVEPWLRRVRASRDDLEFYEISAEYVASLQDAHSSFNLPSRFSASLGFHVDIYDGKVLFDSITRSRLPSSQYPFGIGWELVSMDGVPVEELLRRLSRFVYSGNPRSRLRSAAQIISVRSQARIPRAHEIGETATIVVRNQQGEEFAFTIPWLKNGVPITSAGMAPSPKLGPARPAGAEPDEDIFPAWLEPLAELRKEIVEEPYEVLNIGSRFPIYAFPAGFEQRLGRTAAEFFTTGVYEAGGFRIGLLRIPNFAPSSTGQALRQFESEIAFFEENTDGLIIDVKRNNGGDACYNEEIQRRLIPYQFQGIAREFRATTRWVNSFSNALEVARAQRAEPYVIALLEARLNDIVTAYRENRGRTGPLPLCAETLTRQPADIVYTKPLLVLVDEFSISAADAFPAVIQDNARGPLFGTRTMGAGGTTGSFPATVFSEATASHTAALHHRRRPVVTPDFPTSGYVENIGVRPDIEYDYMTRQNLIENGRPFVEAFTAAMVEHIRNSR